MRLTVRVFGLELLAIEASKGDEEPDIASPPRTFGFHASGIGLIERGDTEPLS